jgi:hypothetical protein
VSKMTSQLDDLLGDVPDNELVLNDEYMRKLEHSGLLAAKQRRDALLSSVRISEGVARAGLRAIKQATASELQKVTSKKRNLDSNKRDIVEKLDNENPPDVLDVKLESKVRLSSTSLISTSTSSKSIEDLGLAQEYSELQTRIRSLDPTDILLHVLSKHNIDISTVVAQLLASATPDGASKKRPRESSLLESSPELDLILSNKLFLQWEKSLVRWVKASAFKNLKAEIQASEAASTTLSTHQQVIVPNELMDDSGQDVEIEPETTLDDLNKTQSSAEEISKPSNRQLKREERERMKRAAMHIHGRGAGFGRGLTDSGEPKFEDLHPSWRLQKVMRAKIGKIISKDLKKGSPLTASRIDI